MSGVRLRSDLRGVALAMPLTVAWQLDRVQGALSRAPAPRRGSNRGRRCRRPRRRADRPRPMTVSPIRRRESRSSTATITRDRTAETPSRHPSAGATTPAAPMPPDHAGRAADRHAGRSRARRPPDPIASLETTDRRDRREIRQIAGQGRPHVCLQEGAYARSRCSIRREAQSTRRSWLDTRRRGVRAPDVVAIARRHASTADGLDPGEYKIPNHAGLAGADAQAEAVS